MSTHVQTFTKPAEHRPGMTAEQVELIRRTLAAKASDDELALFIGHANRTGLDPFAHQIYLVPRRAKVDNQWVETHQTMVSIDGARLIAQRSGKFRGETRAEWCADDGVWRDSWLVNDPPAAARVAVIHADYPENPVWGVARYGAYVQTVADGAPNRTWQRMPDVMLAKCAEMLALRKAFQQDLSGLVIEEESGTDPVLVDPMGEVAAGGKAPARHKITREEQKALVAAAKQAGLVAAELKALLRDRFDVDRQADLYQDQMAEVLGVIEAAGLDDVAAVTDAEIVEPDGDDPQGTLA